MDEAEEEGRMMDLEAEAREQIARRMQRAYNDIEDDQARRYYNERAYETWEQLVPADHERWLKMAEWARHLVAESRAGARVEIEKAIPVLKTCARLFGGAGMGGPGALEQDCLFAIRALNRALAAEGGGGGDAMKWIPLYPGQAGEPKPTEKPR